MKKIRVLTVDDAVVVRRLLSDALSGEPDMEIVGAAATGRIALQKIPQCTPDVVTMDVEMPEMDGISTVREIRRQWPKLPVIMFSTLTERGAAATLDALSAGASDYVTKPANVGGVTAGLARIRDELAPKIRSLAASVAAAASSGIVHAAVSRGEPRPPARVALPVSPPSSGGIDVLAIGTSTGGPNALATVIPALPADLGVPILIVQHMPPLFTRLLAERLDQQSVLTVVEARHGMRVLPGHVHIAPGDFHMIVKRHGQDVVVELLQTAPEHSCRPAVDVLFRSVVDVYGREVLGVVMTGMGQDGLAGAGSIRDAAGAVVVQDEASSVVWGMPGFVARAGLADTVCPLSELAPEIVRRIRAAQVRARFRTRVGGMAR